MNAKTKNPNHLQLEAENIALSASLAERDEADRQRAADEGVIAEKVRHGLSRQQAAGVIQRQREFDARKANDKAARQEKLAGILTGRETMSDAIERARTVFPDHMSPTVIAGEVREFMNARASSTHAGRKEKTI